MFFKIDPHNGVPVYEQVVRQVTFAIADGSLRTGEMIPSVRQLARKLAINHNTVARAYRELQEAEIVESIRGTGLQVSQGARKTCQSNRQRIFKARFKSMIAEARQSQLSDEEIRKILTSELSKKRKES